MKKIILSFLTFITFSAHAAVGDIAIQQYINTFQTINYLLNATAGTCLIYIDNADGAAKCATYDSSILLNSGVLSAKGSSPAQQSASRALNSAFQISTTKNATVYYSVKITSTASIGSGQDGDVILEIASDSGFTMNVQTLSIDGNAQTYTLAVALQGIQAITAHVAGYVPAGYYARLRTVNNTGTPTYLYRAGQEVLQ